MNECNDLFLPTETNYTSPHLLNMVPFIQYTLNTLIPICKTLDMGQDNPSLQIIFFSYTEIATPPTDNHQILNRYRPCPIWITLFL